MLAREDVFPGLNADTPVLPIYQAVTAPQKIAAIIRSKLGLNTSVFARNCLLQKIDKTTATKFLNLYHLMNAAQSAYHYGLFHKNELVAVASFSKGRKMNRLPADKRSFELIRFCCKSGITVTGGLSKLVRNFVREKQAGDVMTYVDKQWSDGGSFLRAGFKRAGESEPVTFIVNKNTYERNYYTGNAFDEQQFYLASNFGNLKLVYTPGE